jgi:hypothetical protein
MIRFLARKWAILTLLALRQDTYVECQVQAKVFVKVSRKCPRPSRVSLILPGPLVRLFLQLFTRPLAQADIRSPRRRATARSRSHGVLRVSRPSESVVYGRLTIQRVASS